MTIQQLQTILEGCGGKENITSIDNCITRLRLEVKDITAVNDKVIKSAGVAGVIKPGKTSVQVIMELRFSLLRMHFLSFVNNGRITGGSENVCIYVAIAV